MLTLPFSRLSPCQRLRAYWLDLGHKPLGRSDHHRSAHIARASPKDDSSLRATRTTLEDGSIQFLFHDVEDGVEVEPEVLHELKVQEAVTEPDTEQETETEDDSETDYGTETDDESGGDDQTSDVLNSYTVKDLKKICKQNGVKGYSSLRKREIIKLIRANGLDNNLDGDR